MSSNPRGKGKSISDNNVNPAMNPAYNAHVPQFAIPTVVPAAASNPSMMINNGAQLTRESMPQAFPHGYPPTYNYSARPPPTAGAYPYQAYNQPTDHSREYNPQYYVQPVQQQQYWQQSTYNRYPQQHQIASEMSLMPGMQNVPPPTVQNQVPFNSEANTVQHAPPEPRKRNILLFVDPVSGCPLDLGAGSKPVASEQPKDASSAENEEKKKLVVKDFMSQIGDITTPEKPDSQHVPDEPITSEEVVTKEENSSQVISVDEVVEATKQEHTVKAEEMTTEVIVTAEPLKETSSDGQPGEEAIAQPSVSLEDIEDEISASPAAIPEEETVTAPEPEEDAEKKAEEEAEKMRLREEELDSLFDSLILNPEECDRAGMVYNRQFLYCVRDIEKEFHRTTCPLTSVQIENYGIDLKSMPKSADGKKRADFNPSWAPQRSSMGGNRPNKYTGNRPSDRGGRGNPRNKPYGARPSIDRPVDRKVSLGNKAENAWKPEKITDEQLEDAQNKLKLLLKKVRALMNKITPTTKDDLVKEFLQYQVTVPPENSDLQDSQIKQVIDIIFDKAVEEPKFCPMYSELCKDQVNAELKKDSKVSLFRNCLLTRAQQTFQTKNQEQERAEKVALIDAETDATKKRQRQSELDEFDSKFRRRKFGNIIFIGQLFERQLLSTKIVVWCLFDLINHTHPKDGVCPEPPYDEESLQCAAQLLNSLGKQLERASDFGGVEYLDQTLQHLQSIAPKCSNKIRFLILGVVDLRSNRWIPRKTADQGPKKIDEIHNDIKKEQMETQQQRDSYDKRAGLRMGGGSMRGPNRNAPPPSRSSFDRPTSVKDRRATAASSSKLAGGSTAPKKSVLLAQVDTITSKKGSWSRGASGGSGAGSGPSETKAAWNKNGSSDARKSSSAGLNQREVNNRMSSSQQSLASQEADEETEEQRQEKEEKYKKIATRIKADFAEVESGEMKIEQFVQHVFELQKEEKFGCPKVKEIFARFVHSALTIKNIEEMGRALHLALANKEHRASIIQGVALFCKNAVKEGLVEDFPRLWIVVADLIFFATHSTEKVDPEDELKERAPPVPVAEFESAFIEASQPENEYKMLVLVLHRIADLVHKQHPTGDDWISTLNWTFTDMEFIKKLNQAEFERAMKGAKVPDSHLTLLDIFRHQ